MSAPVRRTQLTDEVADRLRTRIITGEVRPGEFIRLDEAAAEFGCSVTPVREALVTLRGEGLVRSSPHRGFIVDELGRADIEDIFWMQAELSARLATHAARSATLAGELTALTAIVDDLERSVRAGDALRVGEHEYEFHRRVNLAGGSKKLAWFLSAATRYTPHGLYTSDVEWGEQAVASHRRLITHLADGDVDAIRAEIHCRFVDARERLVRSLEGIGFWEGADHSASA
ncbi:GntR family transcriptional regulator [Gordonia alkaliphila]|uniref:GntR family transcriptional regulator n=1 Tax=Gordonia alkaliphila TaxID=1053547 RepID=UPI001FF43796|nr:GntR family transcriptional regulator [Gordonia alkaliphila]MCK0439788.1 GntR family transcriptional regulator [Gordonia alkaliphila]